VLTAIRDDDLYVFTHPEMRVAAEERFAAILAPWTRRVGSGSTEPRALRMRCLPTKETRFCRRSA
jgi:hypothetical protein